MARPKPDPERSIDTSIGAYRRKRDFRVTDEPAPRQGAPAAAGRMFVVQKHAARRAGLHWDFRLEHGGVLWSWAVPKGPSLDPADRRVAVHVEDHPIDYADFQGVIPEGQYGAGAVDTWDRGTWEPEGDPDEAMRKGDLRFVLHGRRLQGRFHLVRLRGRGRSRQDAWFLIKGHDAHERAGGDATTLEAAIAAPAPPTGQTQARAAAPAPGAVRAALPERQAPQLAELVAESPHGPGWLAEIKFDGYRLLAAIDHGKVRLLTRNGHDWTDRLPAVARAVGALDARTALLDGELVALRDTGVSSFPDLQAALSAGQDGGLKLFLFDLLHLNGWDLRPCRLVDRKAALHGLSDWQGMLRFSDHIEGSAESMRRQACGMGLEGIVCKRLDAPYRAGRGHGWVKVKCTGREELIVLGWTPPGGRRTGLGALQLGYHDPQGALHFAGGVGTGFSDHELAELRARLEALAALPPAGLLAAGDKLDPAIRWVRPELVVEVQFTGWSGAGRVRHPVFLGLREDKTADQVVRPAADPDAPRAPRAPKPGTAASRRDFKGAVPPVSRPAAPLPAARVVVARAPQRQRETVGGVEISHADRPLWPGISKRDLAEYWLAVAPHALPGLAGRPLAIVRCPEGIGGEHFFQKRGNNLLPSQIREGTAEGSPYLALDDAAGLVAMAQISAIELHPWGAPEADPLHPDQIVFDLDPGEGVPFGEVIRAAHDVRNALQKLGLGAFPRTTGGKGLHVVVPVTPAADWDHTKAFCRALAETMSEAAPDRFLPTLSKAQRRGRILIDWLRNGLGSTAIGSFCPRARPGAPVAVPLAWAEVKPGLDPAAFTLRSVPGRLRRQKRDPWAGFRDAARPIHDAAPPPKVRSAEPRAGARIVVARAPRKRS